MKGEGGGGHWLVSDGSSAGHRRIAVPMMSRAARRTEWSRLMAHKMCALGVSEGHSVPPTTAMGCLRGLQDRQAQVQVPGEASASATVQAFDWASASGTPGGPRIVFPVHPTRGAVPCRSTPPPHRCHKTTKHRISAMILHSAGGGGWANDITLTGGGGGGHHSYFRVGGPATAGGEGGIRLLSEGGAQRHGGGGVTCTIHPFLWADHRTRTAG